MIAAATKLTYADHGRLMALSEFWDAEIDEGLRVELFEGVIEVSDIPSIEHALIEDYLNHLVEEYRTLHPGHIKLLGRGGNSKLFISSREAERHPDISLYLTDPPPGDQPWKDWTPAIVIEIVSASSRHRDYVAKMTDYWLAGVQEYWIIDPQDGQVQLCVRGAGQDWTLHVRRGEQPVTSDLLPGFSAPAAIVLSGGK